MKTTALILFFASIAGASFPDDCFQAAINQRRAKVCHATCLQALNQVLDNAGASERICKNYEYKMIQQSLELYPRYIPTFGVAMKMADNYTPLQLNCAQDEIDRNSQLDFDHALFLCLKNR